MNNPVFDHVFEESSSVPSTPGPPTVHDIRQKSGLPLTGKRLLVANRGEIAVRIIRSVHELSMSTVSIFSHEDRFSSHRYKSDEAYQVGKDKPPVSAYLDQDDIIRIAKEHKVDLIHPGYGFLSENAEFAKKCHDNGIIFVGPTPEAIDGLGDKVGCSFIYHFIITNKTNVIC